MRGGYRHRVQIEKPVESRDSTTGDSIDTWEVVVADVPAKIEAVPTVRSKEQTAAGQVHGRVDTHITIRWLPELLDPSMRIVNTYDSDRTYNIRAIFPDPTQRQEIAIHCDTGTDNG